MKVVLVTSFEDRFLEQDTLPELARRGIEVVSRFEAKDCRSYDFDLFKSQGATLILHMHEVGAHSASESLTRLARESGLPIKALSRKKASWTFLPAPLDAEPVPSPAPSEPRRRFANHYGTVNIASGANAALEDAKEELALIKIGEGYLHASLDSDIPVPPNVEKFLKETRFDRRTARLRDVVQLILGHNVSDPEHVLRAVMNGREAGTFPRLMRLRKDDIPKLVAGILEHETAPKEARTVRHMTLDPSDQKRFEAIGLVDPNLATPEESAALAARLKESDDMAKVVPMQKQPSPVDELAALRAQVADLQAKHAEYGEVVESLGKFKKAHEAFRTLIALGMMTPVEAAEKLFGEPLA